MADGRVTTGGEVLAPVEILAPPSVGRSQRTSYIVSSICFVSLS
jgi:hypothetical protein